MATTTLVATSLVSARSGQGPSTPSANPPLPRIVVDAFPEASRDEIGAALRAAAERPDDAQAVGRLGMLLQAWHQYDAAAGAYQRAQALAPDEPDWWYLGGLTDNARARPAAAARQFARAVELTRTASALVTLRLADARRAQGDLDAAATLYRSLVTDPDHAAFAWHGLGRIALARGEAATAREALEQAVALAPAFGAAHYALAQVYRRTGDRSAALEALARQRRCPSCEPLLDDPWQQRVSALRDDAFALLTRGIAAAAAPGDVLTDAIRLHEAALQRPETRGRAHLNLIELYRRLGDVEQARTHYQAALAEAGFAAEAHRQFAAVLLDRQQDEEALRLLEQATTLAPGDAAAWQGRGLALERLGRIGDAAAAYGTALRVAPDADEARFALARLAMRTGQVEQAVAYLEALRAGRSADTPRYLFALSTAYARQGRGDEARQAATEALALARQIGDARMAAFIEREMRKLEATP